MSQPVPFLQSLYNSINSSLEGIGRPVWSEKSKRWFVLHPRTVTLVLRSDHFSVVRHHDELSALQESLDIDLQATIDAAQAMPLSHDGEKHRELKRESAQLIQDVTGLAVEEFRSFCSRLLPEILERHRSIDLVAELVAPASARLFSVLTGFDEEYFVSSIPAGYCPTQLLTSAKQSLSAPRWRMINRQVDRRQRLAKGSRSQSLVRSALSLLTYEIFKAALSNSLIHVIRESEGLPLNTRGIASQLPATSIPFVDRICHQDTNIDGETIRQGQNVLLYLGGCSPDGLEQRRLFFGTGSHICIGKPVTEAAWSTLAQILRKRPERIRIRDVSFRELDVVLLAPTGATMEISR